MLVMNSTSLEKSLRLKVTNFFFYHAAEEEFIQRDDPITTDLQFDAGTEAGIMHLYETDYKKEIKN